MGRGDGTGRWRLTCDEDEVSEDVKGEEAGGHTHRDTIVAELDWEEDGGVRDEDGDERVPHVLELGRFRFHVDSVVVFGLAPAVVMHVHARTGCFTEYGSHPRQKTPFSRLSKSEISSSVSTIVARRFVALRWSHGVARASQKNQLNRIMM